MFKRVVNLHMKITFYEMINGYYASKNINKDREFTTTLLINDGSLCL